jgi:hypothetical protein
MPAGGGLSSSAAIVCASALAVMRMHGIELTKGEVSEFTARAERYVGVTSGGMDQAISVMGMPGIAKLVEFNPVGGRGWWGGSPGKGGWERARAGGSVRMSGWVTPTSAGGVGVCACSSPVCREIRVSVCWSVAGKASLAQRCLCTGLCTAGGARQRVIVLDA